MPANIGQPLLQPGGGATDRRRSMPSRTGPLLDDDEHEGQQRKRSPLANTVALPEDVEEEEKEVDASTESVKPAAMEVDP